MGCSVSTCIQTMALEKYKNLALFVHNSQLVQRETRRRPYLLPRLLGLAQKFFNHQGHNSLEMCLAVMIWKFKQQIKCRIISKYLQISHFVTRMYHGKRKHHDWEMTRKLKSEVRITSRASFGKRNIDMEDKAET